MELRRALAGVAVALAGGISLAACSSTPSQSASTSTSSTTTSSTTTSSSTTSSSTTTSSTTTSSTTTTTVALPAETLPVTAAVTAQLIQAAAAENSLPASAYTGLQPGLTYYAYDTVTKTYWAGAALKPSPSSQRAQVSVQDDGSYVLFSRPSGGAWKAVPVGMTGIEGAKCPSSVPAAVLTLWGWAAGTCRPPSS